MSLHDGWVTIVPAPGEITETARALLALAGDPRDVVSQRGGTEFLVPPEIGDVYLKPAPTRRARKTKESGS